MSRIDSMVMFRPPSDTSQSIMVLDLAGSSGMASEDEVMAVHLRRRVEQLASPMLEANQVGALKNTGDGFLATFADAMSAAKAAVGILAILEERNRKTVNPPIRVRLALHFGKTYSVFDSGTLEIYGNDVNIVFRIECLQAAGIPDCPNPFPEADRVLCTKEFKDELKKTPYHSHVKFVSCGLPRLKGINQPVEVFWMQTSGDDSRVQE